MRGAHLPGWSAPQPSPSQVPEVHSVLSRQAAPSALPAPAGTGVKPPPPVSGGGGAGGIAVVSWVAPGSFVVGGVSVGSGEEVLVRVAGEQAASTRPISMIRTGMAASYTPHDG